MPQESCLTATRPPTNRISQLTGNDLIHLLNAQLESISNPDAIRPNIGSRNQEHANDGQECKTGLQPEQVVAFEMAEEGAITTVQTGGYDEDSEASFRRLVKRGRSGELATSSMEVSAGYDHGIDERMSTGHTSTVTPSIRSMQRSRSHGRGTDETRTAEHTSTVTDITDGTSLPDIDEEDDETEDGTDHLPPQVDITLLHMLEPPTPLGIVQLACSMADQTDVTVTEEEHRSFQRQPLEVQRHSVRVFFKELADSQFSLQD